MVEIPYYICRWVLYACKSESLRRSITSAAENLMHLVKSCSMDKSVQLPDNLPTRKVTRLDKYGGLIYPNESFFCLSKV